MTAQWFCEAHRVTTSRDCPKCDAEQIADLDRYARLPICEKCDRTLTEGEAAWASDVKVIEREGVHIVTRYTCDDCEPRPLAGTQ